MNKAASHLAIGLIALACQAAVAQSTDPLKDAVQRAISTNPEVTARLNAFRAATDEVDVARGAYYPRVDLGADASRIRERIGSVNQSMTSTGVSLSATQLLWDGFQTMNQVDRLGHARLVRYFEFIDTSEQVALESVRAYVDVQRQRRLVKLAEDNYVQHRYVLEQLQSRVKAGVGRGVDMEQASARFALAESNLTTETSNLHDVTERFRRLTGGLPPVEMPGISGLERGLPATSSGALEQAVKRNAGIAAAVENLRAAQAVSREKEGNLYQPRVEARVRTAAGNNLDGTADQKRDTTAGLSLNWNLFNGGSDKARVRQAANLLNQAADTRDKACRDARQTAAIAYQDTVKLAEQLSYLDRHVLSSEKVRDAYRQQFDIGQRTLLDLLNSENELYSARRAYANAEYDLQVAKARTHSATSSLVAALGLTRAGNAEDEPSEGRYWQAGEEAATRCPISATDLQVTPKSDLDARARQLGSSLSTLPAGGVAAAAPASRAMPAPAPAADPAPSTPVSQRLLDWVATWAAKDATRYLSFYDPSFKPAGATRQVWFANRTKLLKKDGPVEMKIANVQRRTVGADVVETRFDQHYISKDMDDKSQKVLTWKRRGGEWYIVKEATNR
ncbi:TolC family outer membrane protein [Sphaerotilus uruguayifluvii]|uniref:Adhesin transport system outer membrane protein n=1 Tax=Sphaerotilus uruguayifluvii TaxID=2735897 RepID=A0ABX2G3L7_9BURK|nr:TolC family outer membrane protein [Leptothrix sp. C29]NRT55985.1 adhesin transport system outer membrane protein [Leptothrix sp. C29]